MLKISLFLLTISLSLSSLSQYTQSLDGLNRKEIRKLIINQDDSKKANNLMELHQGAKFFSVIGYTIGVFAIASGEAPKNDQEVNLAGLLGAVFIGSALVFTIISETAYFHSVKAYRKTLPSIPSSKVFIRDSREIYDSIY
ncbi:hypothetical protein [Ekhidna sp.]|uniref:hypothetical protein n=1 Tax=Ekhidna sp. TaxID=2608089 RepID=UPI0032993FF6